MCDVGWVCGLCVAVRFFVGGVNDLKRSLKNAPPHSKPNNPTQNPTPNTKTTQQPKQCTADLAAAEPVIAEAEAALNSLDKASLGELKSFGSPAAEVVQASDFFWLAAPFVCLCALYVAENTRLQTTPPRTQHRKHNKTQKTPKNKKRSSPRAWC